MNGVYAGVQCFVEIYPFEATSFEISRAKVLTVEVTRNLREDSGSFTVALVPGGPNGVDAAPAWIDLITSMSLVVIGMSRGNYAQIVMIGVVTGRAESIEWKTSRGVDRAFVIRGFDFSYYFTTFNYYALSYLGITAGAVAGQLQGGGNIAMPNTLSLAYNYVTPDKVGTSFLNEVMLSPQTGVLGQVQVPYKNNTFLGLQDALGVAITPYPNITIPTAQTLITTEGSWLAKFRAFFPFPFFEFFITTAPLGSYGTDPNTTEDANLNQNPGYPFTMKSLPNAAAAAPMLVARPNPFPNFNISNVDQEKGFTVSGMDMSLWQKLKVYTADSGAAIMSRPGFSLDEVRNFYGLDPTYLRQLYNDSNTSVFNFLFSSLAAVDFASVNRYGYRPEIVQTDWFADPTGIGTDSFYTTMGNLLGRVCSFYEPTPFMSRCEATINLRPDILPGNIFRFRPFTSRVRNGQVDNWDYYIEGVSHRFDFPSLQAVTGLNLSRGLPTPLYQDSGNGGLLQAVHEGKVQQVDGIIQAGLPQGQNGLISFGPGQYIQQYLGQLSPAFVNPQGG